VLNGRFCDDFFQCPLLSAGNDFCKINFQSRRDPQQRIQAWTLDFLFNIADRLPRNSRFCGKQFKREIAFFTFLFQYTGHLRTDGIAWIVSRHREAIPKKNVDKGCQNTYMNVNLEKVHKFMFGQTKILIIENDTPVAMLMVYLLSQTGCDVSAARNGKTGLELARERKFDLITLDVDLPDIDGFEICRQLKENSRLCNTPVVFISARDLEEDMRHGIELGAVDYIAKPFETLEFAPRLLSHIKKKVIFVVRRCQKARTNETLSSIKPRSR
jgi:CheY-like chemotaxis protein